MFLRFRLFPHVVDTTTQVGFSAVIGCAPRANNETPPQPRLCSYNFFKNDMIVATKKRHDGIKK